nr:hypothetical protein [uncultured Oscillibacter sp.]
MNEFAWSEKRAFEKKGPQILYYIGKVEKAQGQSAIPPKFPAGQERAFPHR